MPGDISSRSRILTKEEIKNLNKDGYKLDESGNELYLVKFLFNDRLNNAGDPMPFQIATESLDKIAKTFINRPYVFNPGIKNNVGQHVRGPVDDPKKIIEYQKAFSIGEIVNYFINKVTRNVNGIVRIFKEYKDEVLTGKIPLPTSPLLEPLKWENGKLVDARGLHLQAVPNPGYPVEIASITGACVGMLDKCSTELRTLGASGKLKQFRKNYIYNSGSLGASMPDPTDPNTPPTDAATPPKEMNNMELTTAVSELQTGHKAMKGMVEEMHAKIMGTGGKPGETPTVGSAGKGKTEQELVQLPKDEIDAIKNELETVKNNYNKTAKELEDEKNKVALEKRRNLAEIIAKGELFLKKITPEQLKERIEHYIKLVDDNKQPKDLSLLAENYKDMQPKTLGSYGYDESIFPEMAGDSQPDTFETMENIG